MAAFVAVLRWSGSRGCCSATPTRWARSGLVLLAIPALLPASLSEVHGRQGVDHRRRLLHPARASSPSSRWPCSSPATWSPSGTCSPWRARVLGIDLPRARDLGPVLICWVASLLILIFETDIGTSALFFGLFVVDDLHRHPADLVAADRRPAVPGRRVRGQQAVQPRRASGSTSGCTRSPGTTPPTRPTSWCRAWRGWRYGGILGSGLGHGQPYFTPLVQSDFIITAFGEELGLTGLMAILLIFGADRAARAARRGRGP